MKAEKLSLSGCQATKSRAGMENISKSIILMDKDKVRDPEENVKEGTMENAYDLEKEYRWTIRYIFLYLSNIRNRENLEKLDLRHAENLISYS